MSTLLRRLGPGLLFAGAAIGVSHLVYSTRAGALYSFSLLWLVIVANLFKYPFFEFGPRYAAATGESLLHGYKRLGTVVLWGFVVVTLLTMFTIQAAVTLVTAGLAMYLTGATGSPTMWSLGILVLCSSLLIAGRYYLLDQLMKLIIVLLTLLTLITVVVAYGSCDKGITWAQDIPTDSVGFAFVIAFMGWLPAPMDLSVWHSLWTIQKQKTETFSPKAALFDFNVGYIGTTMLALFFMSLGALVIYGSDVELSSKAIPFSKQLIQLYTQTLGDRFGFFVGLAAFITMFSTTLTCMDALPRSMAQAQHLLSPTPTQTVATRRDWTYYGWLLILIIGTLVLLSTLLVDMASFLQIATILSFLTAPFFALANYRLVTAHLPAEHRPNKGILTLSWLGIAYLFVFCALYIYSLF